MKYILLGIFGYLIITSLVVIWWKEVKNFIAGILFWLVSIFADHQIKEEEDEEDV